LIWLAALAAGVWMDTAVVAGPGVEVANGVRTVETASAGPDDVGRGPGVSVELMTMPREAPAEEDAVAAPPQPAVNNSSRPTASRFIEAAP
jgi:hypothetical protein